MLEDSREGSLEEQVSGTESCVKDENQLVRGSWERENGKSESE